MPNNNGTESFFTSTLKFVECCDCGLVHTIKFGKEDGKDIVTFIRNEVRTRMAREKPKPKKTMCELLAEARLKEFAPTSDLKNFIEQRVRNLA